MEDFCVEQGTDFDVLITVWYLNHRLNICMNDTSADVLVFLAVSIVQCCLYNITFHSIKSLLQLNSSVYKGSL